jgi:hypothetical protein
MTELNGRALHLSIIDLLMHAGFAGATEALARYELIEPRRLAVQPT